MPREGGASQPNYAFRLGCLAAALVIGLRYHVGADWIPYEIIFDDARGVQLDPLASPVDPGYYFINSLVQQLGGQLWIVNVICAFIFCWGLMRFCEVQQRPWLAALVAVPYLVIVVAMGYTRQAVAIGLIMAGLATYFRTGSVLRFAVYALLAATFHRTAVVAVPLIALGNERGRVVAVIILIAVTYLLYELFLSASVSRFVTNYIDARYASEGAGIRLAMNFVPAVLFLLWSRRMHFSERERRVWRNLAFVSVGFVALFFFVPSSTAVDRLALYAIPLQLAVLSRPGGMMMSEGLGTSIIMLYSAAVQFTWLMFAHHARFWLPYHFWPLLG